MSAVDLPTLRAVITIDGRSRTLGPKKDSALGNPRWSTSMPGGYDTFTCQIDDSERQGRTNIYKYGAKVTLYADSGPSADQILWQGYLKTPVPSPNGVCTLNAVGWSRLFEERDEPRLWLTYNGWTDMDSPPFADNFTNSDNIDTRAGERNIQFLVRKGDEIVPENTARAGWWFPDHQVRYVAWSQSTNRDNPTSGSQRQYSLKLERYPNAAAGAGGAIVVADFTPTGKVTNQSKSQTLASTVAHPFVAFRFRYEGKAKKEIQYAYKLRLTNLRVGDYVQADTYKAHEVMQDVGGWLGFNTTSQVNTGSHDAMPFWHTQGPWSEIAGQMAMNEGGWKWGVWQTLSGGPILEFRPWGTGSTWTAKGYSSNAWAIADISPSDDVYSQVRVTYKIVGHQFPHSITKPTSAGSLLSSLHPPRVRTLRYTLRNPQKDSAQATAIAGRLADEFGATQYSGSLYLSYATESGTDKTAYLIRAGDQVTVPDFPLASTTFRIISTECDEKGVTVGLGRRHIRYHRRPLNRHRWEPPPLEDHRA